MDQPKYDLDIIDPIEVKSKKGLWSLIVPICLMIIVTICVFKVTVFSAYNRAYLPGNWIGSTNFLDGLQEFNIGIVCLVASILIAIFAHRVVLTLGLIGWLLVDLFVIPVAFPRGTAEARYKVEIASYKQAVLSKRSFGDQYTEESLGRKLTYWRWAQFGLDDAIGVIFDPADKLAIEEDNMVFREQSHGTLFRIKKMEPHWYFVEHS